MSATRGKVTELFRAVVHFWPDESPREAPLLAALHGLGDEEVGPGRDTRMEILDRVAELPLERLDRLRQWLDAVAARPARAALAAWVVEDGLGMSTTWPLLDVLRKLVEAGDHLMSVHSCDAHGHEELAVCVQKGREYIARIHAALSSGEAKAEPVRARLASWAAGLPDATVQQIRNLIQASLDEGGEEGACEAAERRLRDALTGLDAALAGGEAKAEPPPPSSGSRDPWPFDSTEDGTPAGRGIPYEVAKARHEERQAEKKPVCQACGGLG
jgi:hypothetical protein